MILRQRNTLMVYFEGKSVALSESTDQRFKLSSVTARIEIQVWPAS